jgi:REP element-mobilizing transposase RayT
MPARPIVNTPVFITRRVAQRNLRLLPKTKTTEIFTYLLAVLSQKHKVPIHAACAMSNHWHSAISDPDEAVADFTRDFHSLTARNINAEFGDRESLWNGVQTSHVRPEAPEDLLGLIAYTMANPVKAALVMYGHRWPGLRGAFGDDPITVKKPVGFLGDGQDEDGEDLWPETATLTFARPPGFEHLTDAELAALIKERVKEAETEARREVFARGGTFLGVTRLLQQGRWSRPSSHEALGGISPRVACKEKQRRIERLRANKIWRAEYESSRDRFAAGERDVEFPFGTYQMKIRHNVNVAPP